MPLATLSRASRRRPVRLAAAAAAAVSLAVAVPATSAGATATHHAPLACRSAVLDPSLAHQRGGLRDVLVIGRPAHLAGVAAAVSAAGGHVSASEPIIDGVRAAVPASRLHSLTCSPDIVSVTPNSAVHFQSLTGPTGTGVGDGSFLQNVNPKLLSRVLGGGAGVGVAVIDTGISPEPDFAGRVVYGPDLSGEGTTIDSYGHGTAMAGIIGSSGHDSNGQYAGIAPKSTLVSVKVAGRNGATDVSTVLEAMHWVAAYKNEFNIRVLNLSWGTPSTQSPTIDPLDYAVERLWRLGIVVVVSAGNAGPDSTSILKPADDPMVLSVGAYDGTGTASQDTVPAWSSSGPTLAGYAKPDLVAPGRTVVTDRSWGSQVEKDNPDALIGTSYIKGSGTSEAAAVTSGTAALLLGARPNLTPDQVKHLLTTSAKPIPGTAATRQGAGRLNLVSALFASAGPATQQTPVATGLGSLEASRGGHHVQVDCNHDGTADVIVGEIDATCHAWNGASWTGASWTGASWTGASWTGASWTGASWTGASWTGASWTGASWTGGTWAGASWTGASWTGASWTGASWTGASWTGASWTGASWTTEEWNSAPSGPSEFQTAWWGDEPKPGQDVPGEPS